MNKHLRFLFCCPLPLMALFTLSSSVHWQLILSYLVIISTLTATLNWQDKRSAEKQGWRISEKSLHLCEFLAGWPTAYIAQQILHHKTSKRSYRIVYWCIVALHQFLALEWITHWRISKAIIAAFR
jgi:uncharacterized membrane protein YsdA (DUF1294 family)